MIERIDPSHLTIECIARALLRRERWLEDWAWRELRAASAAMQRRIVARVFRLMGPVHDSLERCERLVRVAEHVGHCPPDVLERRGALRARDGDLAGAQVDLERALDAYEANGRALSARRLRTLLGRVLALRGRTLESSACLAGGLRPELDRP